MKKSPSRINSNKECKEFEDMLTAQFNKYRAEGKMYCIKVPTEIVLYKNQFKGYWMADIREWTKDPSHYAIIFNDRTNYETEEAFERAGIRGEIQGHKGQGDTLLEKKDGRCIPGLPAAYGQKRRGQPPLCASGDGMEG